MVKDRPILFSEPMVRAVLAGRKTQTRRVCTLQDPDRCRYGRVGDLLWVKETHWRLGKWVRNGLTKTGRPRWRFAATKGEFVRYESAVVKESLGREQHGWHKRPSIFMPRWASRIVIEITNVRVHKLHEITESDAAAEGLPLPEQVNNAGGMSAGRHFEYLWDDINGKRPGCSWGENPWVWALTFRREL